MKPRMVCGSASLKRMLISSLRALVRTGTTKHKPIARRSKPVSPPGLEHKAERRSSTAWLLRRWIIKIRNICKDFGEIGLLFKKETFFYDFIFIVLPHLVMCEHLRLWVKKEQLLQTVDLLRDGQSWNVPGSRLLGATRRQPVQQVATQLETDIVPNLLNLKYTTEWSPNEKKKKIHH